MARRSALLAVLVLLAALIAGCGSSDETATAEQSRPAAGTDTRPVIRLGTKDFTEQFVLGELYAQALRAEGFRVDVKRGIGSSEIVDEVMTSGAIDLYPEYMGVIVSEIAKQENRPASAEETYRRAKAFQARRGFAVLDMSPGSDRLANAVTPATARRYRLRTMADLERLGRYRYGGYPENRVRFQGAVGVREEYGLDFKFVPLRADRRHEALQNGHVYVVDVGTTEAQLADRSRYRVLADPKGIFGYQNIAPVVNEETIRLHGPGLARTLDAVTAKLTNAALRSMSGAVDLRGEDPADVARRFLRDTKLV